VLSHFCYFTSVHTLRPKCFLLLRSHFFSNFYCISRMTFCVQSVIELSRMIFEREQKPAELYGESAMLFVSAISFLLS